MKFKKYHPDFISLDDAEEAEFRKWHEVEGLLDCLKVLYPSGPYAVYHANSQEEKTVCLTAGNEFFIETRDGDGLVCLMDYTPDGKWWVRGYIENDGSIPEQTATWDEDHESWRIRSGLPDRRY